MKHDGIDIEVWQDRRLVWQHGGSVRYLVVRITAQDAGDPKPPQWAGHNLAIVVDASPSMEGRPLDESKAFATALVGLLSARDRLSVVSFADDVQIHLASVEMTPVGKEQARLGIHSIRARHGSNLVDGWLQGAELVAMDMEGRSDRASRVLLLSDGTIPNAGQAIEEIEEIARELERRGLPTSAIGIGPELSLGPLVVIDERGGNWLDRSANASERARKVAGEFLDLAPVTATEVTIRVNSSSQLKVQFLDDLDNPPSQTAPTRILGDMRAGADRYVVVKLIFPPGEPGQEVPVAAELRWKNPESGRAMVARPTDMSFVYAVGRANSRQPRDPTATPIVIEAWRNAILGAVLRLNHEERFAEAQHLIEREVFYFARYCSGTEEGDTQLRQLGQAINLLHRPWRNRERENRELFYFLKSR